MVLVSFQVLPKVVVKSVLENAVASGQVKEWCRGLGVFREVLMCAERAGLGIWSRVEVVTGYRGWSIVHGYDPASPLCGPLSVQEGS